MQAAQGIDKRRFERVALPAKTGVYAEGASGGRLGPVTVLGRGGMMIQTDAPLQVGDALEITIVDTSEGIHSKVRAIVRSVMPSGVGLEFVDLQPDEAVEIGVLIGKYYSAAHD